jgi:hypothetical protein
MKDEETGYDGAERRQGSASTGFNQPSEYILVPGLVVRYEDEYTITQASPMFVGYQG